MAFEENWANDYVTTLAGAGQVMDATTSLSCVVTSAAGAPAVPFRLKIITGGVPEYIMVRTVAGTTFSWSSMADRGLGGTSAAAHNGGDTCGCPITAEGLTLGLVRQIVGSSQVGVSPAGGQGVVTASIIANSITDAQMAASSTKLSRLLLEANITRVGPAIQNPGGVTPGAGVWANWGTAYTVTPAVASDLMIFVSANISATNLTAFLMQVLVDGAVTALNPLAGADVTVANKTQCVSLIDYVHNATAAPHTIQVQLKPIAAVTLGSGATGLNLFALAIPST